MRWHLSYLNTSNLGCAIPQRYRECHCGSCSMGRPSVLACSQHWRSQCRCRWPWRAWSKAKTHGFGSVPGNIPCSGSRCTQTSSCCGPSSHIPLDNWRPYCLWVPLWSPAEWSQNRHPWRAGPGWRTRCPGRWSLWRKYTLKVPLPWSTIFPVMRRFSLTVLIFEWKSPQPNIFLNLPVFT